MLVKPQNDHPHGIVVSDASGKWGCGAFHKNKLFQVQWAGTVEKSHITVKELIPIVLAAAVWGTEWTGRTIEAQCDNSAVVAMINWGSGKNPEAMHLMRCLAFFMAKFQFTLVARHIPGTSNVLADALSRGNLSLFLSLYPQADQVATPLPQELLDLVIISHPDWTSPHWTRLWSAIFGQG